jgi:cytochrome c peroxidase
MLFNDARLCQQNYYSCASCHQEDATMDGLNWDLINDGMGNPKNAKSMHDVHDTPPAMWAGVRADMDAAVAAGERFLGFIPNPDNHPALLAFMGAPRIAPNPYRQTNAETLRRGERLFRRTRCHVCHTGETLSDRRKHDLGLAGGAHLRSRFDTPSLREAYRTAPYLHDGRAPTLESIFTEHNPDDLHGRTSALSDAEIADLAAYLRSL